MAAANYAAPNYAAPCVNPYGMAGNMPPSAVSPENFMETAATMGGYNAGQGSSAHAGLAYPGAAASAASASAMYGRRGVQAAQSQKASLGGNSNYMPTDHGTRRLVVSR
jgi:hypothetical protein